MDWMCLGAIKWYAQMLLVLFVIVCVVLIILVLLQKGRGGGLTAALGGAGGQTAFGSKTGDVFTWMTIVVAGLFLILALLLISQYKPYSTTPGVPTIAAPAEPMGGESTGTPALPAEQPATEGSTPAETPQPDASVNSEAPAAPTATTPATATEEAQPQTEQK